MNTDDADDDPCDDATMGKRVVGFLLATALFGAGVAGCTGNGVGEAPDTVSTTTASTPSSRTPDTAAAAASASAAQSRSSASSASSVESVRLAADQKAAGIAAEQEAARVAAKKEAARIAAKKEAARVAAEQEAAEQEAAEQAAAEQAAAEQEAAEQAAQSEGWYDERGWVSPETAARAIAAGISPGENVPNYLRCGTICGESPTSGEIQSQYIEEQAAEQEALQSRIIEAEECLFIVDGQCSGGPPGN